jgi:hypothetical protein
MAMRKTSFSVYCLDNSFFTPGALRPTHQKIAAAQSARIEKKACPGDKRVSPKFEFQLFFGDAQDGFKWMH